MTTARKPAKVYVGDYYRSPVQFIQPPPHVHPKDFQRVYRNLDRDCFSNNPVFVDEAAFADVLVVLTDGSVRPLTAHHAYAKWKGEFRAGEIWSFTRGLDDWNKPADNLHTATDT
jgi:hypothetical protein